jgi:hypothetical protein
LDKRATVTIQELCAELRCQLHGRAQEVA